MKCISKKGIITGVLTTSLLLAPFTLAEQTRQGAQTNFSKASSTGELLSSLETTTSLNVVTESNHSQEVMASDSSMTNEVTSTTDTTEATIDSIETEPESKVTAQVETFKQVIYTQFDTKSHPLTFDFELLGQPEHWEATTTNYQNQIITLDAKVILTESSTQIQTSFYRFILSNGQVGYISTLDQNLPTDSIANYATVTKNFKGQVYVDAALTQSVALTELVNHTFEMKGNLLINGQKWVTLYNHQGKFIGFAQASQLKQNDVAQGAYQAYGKYITFNQKNKTLYQNFDFKVKGNTTSYFNQTMYAKGIYYHFNGQAYYSVYNNKNKWLGYLKISDAKEGNGRQGIYRTNGNYVTLTSKNYKIWQNFSWKQKAISSKYVEQVVLAKGEYRHFNGDTYLSLYNAKGTWLGYVNKKASKVTKPQGEYKKYGKYVTLTNAKEDLYSNFTGKVRNKGSQLVGKTYLAKGKYVHFNGTTYLSLYNQNNTWMGYMKQSAVKVATGKQGAYQTYNKYVSVTKNNYSIWQNFSWKKKSQTSQYEKTTLLAKGRYQHYNGSIYLSLYDNQGTWRGYVNQNATKVGDGKQGAYFSYGKQVTITNKNYPVWRSFNWKKQNTSQTFVNKTFNARGIYYHFNGSSYYSLYNAKGTWMGYINTDAVESYNMTKLIPDQKSLLAVHQVVQQKILDTSKNPNNIIDRVLNMGVITRGQVKFTNGSFVVDVKKANVGMDQIKLTHKELAPAVNYKLLPADKIKGAITTLNSKKKYVALTFDDGPGSVTTPKLLKTLKSKKVKATFFMLGSQVNANPKVAKQVATDGHQIASHTYAHANLPTLSASSLLNEINKADKAIYKATGVLPKAFRPPYGAVNQTVLNAAKKPAILWNVDTRDWESHSVSAINNVVNRTVSNGAIILLHDIHTASVASVGQMIDNLRSRGYEFVTVDQLMQNQTRPLTKYYSQKDIR